MALKLGELFYVFSAKTSDLKKSLKEVTKTNKKVKSSFDGIGNSIAAAFSLEALRRVLMLADNMVRLKGRIDILTKSQKESNDLFKELVDTANKLGVEVNGVITSFQRFALSKDIVGATNSQTLQLTENIQKLGIISGATGQEITSTSIQIGQALTNNFEAAAQEINSINEQMPEVARAVERSLGLASGTFKKAATEGRVSGEQFFNAILEQTDVIEEKFKKMPITINRATATLFNNFAVALTEADKVLGTTQQIAAVLRSAAETTGVDFLGALEGLRKGFIVNFAIIDQAIIEAAGSIKVLGLQIKNFFTFSKRGSDSGKRAILDEIELIKQQTAEKLKGSKDATNGIIADIEIVRNARSKARNTGTIGRLDDGPNKVDGGVATDDASGDQINKIIAAMGSETQAIENALLAREQKILNIEKITEAKRFELLKKSAALRNSQMKALEAGHRAAALQSLETFGDQFNSILAQTGAEGSAIGKAIFLANKGLQVASILASTEVAAIKAGEVAAAGGAVPFYATAAAVRARGMASASLVAGMGIANTFKGGGRQAGGAVFSGAMHPVNETGDPELLQQGAKQYLLPGKKSGNVVPLSSGGAGGGVTVNISNNVSDVADVNVSSMSRGEVIVEINRRVAQGVSQAVSQVDTSLSRGQGSTFRALNRGVKTERNIR